MPAARRTVPREYWLLCIGVFLLGFGVRLVLDGSDDSDRSAPAGAAVVLAQLGTDRSIDRTVAPYGGLGIWVDAFDFSPSYTGGSPPVDPAVVDEYADLGIETIYLQAARLDDRAPGRTLEPDLLAEFLLRAHARGIRVVGWYLPLFADVDADLDRLLAVAELDARGHRFDGVAVDIEYIEAVPDPDERSARLVDLSERLRAARPGETLGAIVPPPVQLEVVNTSYWPRFPWRALDPSYDVWLPMAYWTTRSAESGYRDAYTYTEESVRRLRNNLGRPDAVVHSIGGIGDATTPDDFDGFRRALDATASIGGSLYDWNSLPTDQRALLPDLLPG